MNPQQLVATTGDGVQLSVRRYRPDAQPRSACLAVHAMMANGRYFEKAGFASYLAERGIDLFVVDLRGHGRSRPPSPRHGGQWNFDTLVECDLPAAFQLLAETTSVAPEQHCYLGHSLGGLLGLAATARKTMKKPARLVLCATSVWLEGPSGSRARRALMEIFELSSRPMGFAPARWLRVGSDDEPRAYVEDLCRWARTGRWTSRRGFDYQGALGTIDVPTWVVSGEGDWMCRFDDSERIRSLLPRAHEPRRVGRAYGDAMDPNHFDLFTRPELAPLWGQMADHILG